MLDFGCGSGRTLRHFLSEAESAEIHGCDIHGPSIEWLQEQLSPPLIVSRNEDEPPLPREDGYYDLIWATSVFTHLTESWSRWLLELHRVLAGSGLLIATFMGEGYWPLVTGEQWDEDLVGMTVLRPGNPWESGGPTVLHSPWWVRAHWGRAFEVLELRPGGFVGATAETGQGVVLLRKRAVYLTPADLERPEPEEPRELAALAHTNRLLQREAASLREEVRTTIETFERSGSWRLTRPVRAIGRTLRRG